MVMRSQSGADGRSAASGRHAWPVRRSDGRGPTAGGGREGGESPRRAAIGPVDPYLCGLLPDLNCGLLAQPATHGAKDGGLSFHGPAFPRRGFLAREASAKGEIGAASRRVLALVPDAFNFASLRYRLPGKRCRGVRANPSIAFPGDAAQAECNTAPAKDPPRSGAELFAEVSARDALVFTVSATPSIAEPPSTPPPRRPHFNPVAPRSRYAVLRRGDARDADGADELAVDEDRHAALVRRGAAQPERAQADAAAADRVLEGLQGPAEEHRGAGLVLGDRNRAELGVCRAGASRRGSRRCRRR